MNKDKFFCGKEICCDLRPHTRKWHSPNKGMSALKVIQNADLEQLAKARKFQHCSLQMVVLLQRLPVKALLHLSNVSFNDEIERCLHVKHSYRCTLCCIQGGMDYHRREHLSDSSPICPFTSTKILSMTKTVLQKTLTSYEHPRFPF